MEKMVREHSASFLFAEPPVLPFRTERLECPDCQAPLKVHKTRTKTVSTLHLGCFSAHETLLRCEGCPNPTIYAAEQLSGLAPSGCRFGYDVVVFVGRALFLRHRNTEEIVEELRQRNIRISNSQVGYLGKKFVVYLALAHRQCAPRIKQAMAAQGGYILHLDGTCEGGGPMLMSSLDSISEILLGNVKVPSEKTEELIPFLEEIKHAYGHPLAVVHDMGTGILAAVKAVFPGVTDLICHFHFLRDLGKDLLEADYDALRKRLRHHGVSEKLQHHARRLKAQIDQQIGLIENFCQNVRAHSLPTDQRDRFPLLCAYSLIQWAWEGKCQGDGYGFPFDRPHLVFAKRLLKVGEQLEQMKMVHLRGEWNDNIPLLKLSNDLKKLCADAALWRMIEAIEFKSAVFDQLRQAMRIAESGEVAGLNSGSQPLPMGPIKQALQRFRQEVTTRPDYLSAGHWQSMIKQIDKYWEKLFADPIVVQTPQGSKLIQPQRTNNLMERFFRDLRRKTRRKTGHNSIGSYLQSIIADTPLVRNLNNPEYVEILLKGASSLEERFAQIDIETVRSELAAAQKSPERVPSKIRQLITLDAFPETLTTLFRKVA
jgi:hypothetical protein